jgi:hypothetical protein
MNKVLESSGILSGGPKPGVNVTTPSGTPANSSLDWSWVFLRLRQSKETKPSIVPLFESQSKNISSQNSTIIIANKSSAGDNKTQTTTPIPTIPEVAEKILATNNSSVPLTKDLG